MNWFEIIAIIFIALVILWMIIAQRKDKQNMKAAQEKYADPAYWNALAAENLLRDPYIKPAWATHQIELTEDYVWYHMLADVVRAGTICDARMTPEGHWLAHVNTGLTKGDFTFPDDIVKILKHY